MNDKTKVMIAGAAAGLVNGLLGGGGGTILVPLLAGWLGVETRAAFATSVAVILPLCAFSAVLYFAKGQLDLLQALPYLIGGGVGGMLGGRLLKGADLVWLRRGFAALILMAGFRALLGS